jgi:ubiquinone/menaquinone biosynthesis C-methylase UbiE
MSTQRERRILRSLLASQGHCKIILDLPCGGGRLSDQLATATDLLIEADIAIGQILYGRDTTSLNVPRLWMTASAFHIPFCDNAVDATVCIRLNHHLPSPVERERLVRELLRVSRRFVIMTFFDYHSFKNLFRRVRQPFNHKRAKNTMTVDQIGGLARANNAALVACPQLSTLGSGHRYALLVKSDP